MQRMMSVCLSCPELQKNENGKFGEYFRCRVSGEPFAIYQPSQKKEWYKFYLNYVPASCVRQMEHIVMNQTMVE